MFSEPYLPTEKKKKKKKKEKEIFDTKGRNKKVAKKIKSKAAVKG